MVCEYEAGSLKPSVNLWPFAETAFSDSEGTVTERTWMGKCNSFENIPFCI